MILPRDEGHLASDPRAPRENDLPRAVPIGRADLAVLDDAKIIAAPDDPRDWEEWREQLHRWRDEARARTRYSGARYERADLAWTQRCFSSGLLWLWDEQLYDFARHGFTVDHLLEADEGLGGYDAVVLWHTYPLIGIDERDQFDFYKEVPDLPATVQAFHERGVRVFMEYHAWDRGTLARDDADELEQMALQTGVDGIFLDSQREAPAGVRERLDAERLSVVLEGESNIPLARIADHEMSWAQWQADSPTPGVLRAKWFEPRHMLHQTRRWDRDRTAQLRTAWLNGAGMLVWENVFGSWVGWSPRDRGTLAAMVRVQRRFARHFTHGEWTPLADPRDTDVPSMFSSRFELGGSRLWTIFGSDPRALGPSDAIVTEARDGERWFELVSGRELTPVLREGCARVTLPEMRRPFAAVLSLPDAAVDTSFRDLLRAQAAHGWNADASFSARTPQRVAAPRVSAATRIPEDMFTIRGGERSLTIRYRLRETGMYDAAPFADLWKPLPPLLHRAATEQHAVVLRPFAVARTEVTNAQYARFLTATGYRPERPERFLAQFVDGQPRDGTENEPVRFVSLDDARAYALWAGARLPTEFEWQVAAGHPEFDRGAPLVWNWTESEHSDGRTRFTILKGGSHLGREGSEWYADGGPQPPEFSLKFLRAGPTIERSSAIGFRCAVDSARS